MDACVSWASAVKTYTLVHVLQLFSVMKPSSMNQKKRWAKELFSEKWTGALSWEQALTLHHARVYRGQKHRRTTRSQNFVFMITIPQRDNFQTKQTEHQKEMCLEALQRAAGATGARIIRGSATATQQKPRIRQSNIHSGAKGHNPARKVVTRFFEDSIEMGMRDRVAVRARSHVCWTMGCTAGWGAHWVIV